MKTPTRPDTRRWRASVRRVLIALAVVFVSACARDLAPAPLDPANTLCGSCRMAVSDVRFAAQIAAPGAEPIFFDDIGCLRDYLKQPGVVVPADAVAFVADHRTGAWVRAASAVFTRAARIGTPMGGGVIAHEHVESRRQDADAAAGTPVTAAELFGPAGPPNGGAR